MKKLLVYVLFVIILLVGAALIWLATQNGTIDVSRNIEINASPQKVYNLVSNLNVWRDWSPWIAIEPDAETEISGKGNEAGNSLKWEGNLIGSGSITHISLEDLKSIHQHLNIITPFKSEADVLFTFEPTSDGVNVAWKMKSKMPFLFRFLTSQMESMTEMDFDRGLKMLKDLAENDKVSSRVVVKGIEKFDGTAYVGKNVYCTKETVGPAMEQTIYDVGNWLVANSTFPEEALSIYYNFGMNNDTIHFTSGYRLLNTHKSFPFSGAIVDSIPRCNILKVTFYGDYKHLGNAWTAGYSYIQHNKLKPLESIPPFEIYLNDPAFFPNSDDWVTDVCIPIEK